MVGKLGQDIQSPQLQNDHIPLENKNNQLTPIEHAQQADQSHCLTFLYAFHLLFGSAYQQQKIQVLADTFIINISIFRFHLQEWWVCGV